MEFRTISLFFMLSILNLFFVLSRSMDWLEVPKENIRKEISERMESGKKIKQKDFDESAGKEVAKLRNEYYPDLIGNGMSHEDAIQELKNDGLAEDGPIYHELRTQGLSDLTVPKENVKKMITDQQFTGEKITQEHFDKYAAREVDDLQRKTYERMAREGYNHKQILYLMNERGLSKNGKIYNELRKPHIDLETGLPTSMNFLKVPKENIRQKILEIKGSGTTIKQHHFNGLADKTAADFQKQEFQKLMQEGHSRLEAIELMRQRGILEHKPLYEELRKPSILLSPSVYSRKRKTRFQSSEGSSSGSENKS